MPILCSGRPAPSCAFSKAHVCQFVCMCARACTGASPVPPSCSRGATLAPRPLPVAVALLLPLLLLLLRLSLCCVCE